MFFKQKKNFITFFLSRRARSVKVLAGANDLGRSGTSYQAKSFVRHPQYNNRYTRQSLHDLALIKIDGGRIVFNDFVQRIYLAEKSVPANSELKLSKLLNSWNQSKWFLLTHFIPYIDSWLGTAHWNWSFAKTARGQNAFDYQQSVQDILFCSWYWSHVHGKRKKCRFLHWRWGLAVGGTNARFITTLWCSHFPYKWMR